MTRVNTVKGDELYVRCIYCGDSQKSADRAHLAVNLHTGLFHCLRCNKAGKVTQQVLFELQLRDFPGLDYGTGVAMPDVIAGPGTNRKSPLERFHTMAGEDIFKSWWHDAHVGYYLRSPTNKRLWGFSGFNWMNAPTPLTSTPDNPLYFVEGPYDVRKPQDVCFFGIPSYTKINQFFKEHFFVIAPDGDLWTQQNRFVILKGLIDRLIHQNIGLMGVLFLPKATDPDEAKNAKLIPTDFFKRKLWSSISLSSKAQLELARVQ